MPYISKNCESYLGKTVPDGHCVALIKEACNAPETAKWKRGEQVNIGPLAKGTAIATFDPNGKYGNHTDGRSHAAILLAVYSDGLMVIDQWKGQIVHERKIQNRSGQGDAVNDGDAYYVIE